MCVFILYMYKLFLNEVQQDVIRGSIGLADGAGTPLKQGQDIPLTGATHQPEVSEWASEWERDGEKWDVQKAEAFFFFFSFLSAFPHFPP